MIIDARNMNYRSLNKSLRNSESDCTIFNCLGQRFIASGMYDKHITVNGIPGNASGECQAGGTIIVLGIGSASIPLLVTFPAQACMAARCFCSPIAAMSIFRIG